MSDVDENTESRGKEGDFHTTGRYTAHQNPPESIAESKVWYKCTDSFYLPRPCCQCARLMLVVNVLLLVAPSLSAT